MEDKLSYYATKIEFLSDKEPIYLNKACEQAESHLHAHDFIEIAYVAKGIGTHSIGDNIYNVSKGDLFIINYNIPHEFRSLEDPSKPRLWVYNCIFQPGFLDYTLVNCKDFSNITQHFLFRSIFPEEATLNDDIKLQSKESQEIEDLYEKMYREFKLKDEGYIEIIRAYVIELLITIFRLYKRTEVINNRLETHRQEIMNRVTHYMKNNYRKDLKLEDLSTMAFLSPNYFAKLFKECTSMTISEYVQNIRIEEACHLLKTTEKKVIDIAFEVGYKDIKYFNQIFKKISGKTPGDYRK